MLTKEEVLHVLNLARLEASEEEIEKYQDEIDKIKELDNFDDELMIAPWSHDVTLRENDSLKIEEANVLENVPCKKGNFIAVDVEVLKDE